MADTNPAGQNLPSPLPPATGQPTQNQTHKSRKKYLAVLGVILVVAVGLGAYFFVGGQLFKGFIGEEYENLKECVEGLPEEILINSEYPIMVREGCDVQLASNEDYAKFIYSKFDYEQGENYNITLTGETNVESPVPQWFRGEELIGTNLTETFNFESAGSHDVTLIVAGVLNGTAVELISTKTIVVEEPPAEDPPVVELDSPTLIAPTGEISDTTPTFEWTLVEGAENYDLEVWEGDQNPNPANVMVIEEANIVGNNFTIPDESAFASGQTFSYMVAARDPNPPWAAYWSDRGVFSTAAEEEVDPNLIAHWKLDETANTIANDSSANGVDGQIIGHDVNDEDDELWEDGGYTFYGGNYIDVGDRDLLDITGKLSISLWFKVPFMDQIGVLVNKYDNGPNLGYVLHMGNSSWGPSGNILFRVDNGSASKDIAMTDNTFKDNQWHHLAAVYEADGSTRIKIYVDGTEQVVTREGSARSDIGNAGTKPFRIGQYSPDSHDFSFNGNMDDIRIYNRALTTEEISQFSSQRPQVVIPVATNFDPASFIFADVFHSTLSEISDLPANAFTATAGDTIKFITFDQPAENAVFVRFNDKQWDFDVKESAETCEIPADQKLQNMATSAADDENLTSYFSTEQVEDVEGAVTKIRQLIPVFQELIQKMIELLEEVKTLVTLDNVNQMVENLSIELEQPVTAEDINDITSYIDLLIGYGNEGLDILEGDYVINDDDHEIVANIKYAVNLLTNFSTEELYQSAFISGGLRFRPDALENEACREALRNLQIDSVVNSEEYATVYVDATNIPAECFPEDYNKDNGFGVKMLKASQCNYLPDELIIPAEILDKVDAVVDEILEDKNALIDILDRVKNLLHEFNADESKNICKVIGNVLELGEYFRDQYFEEANWPPFFFEHIYVLPNQSVEIAAPYLGSADFTEAILRAETPADGILTAIDSTTLRYTPNPDFEGFDGFIYTLILPEENDYAVGNLELFDYIRNLVLGEEGDFSNQSIGISFALNCIEVGVQPQEPEEEEVVVEEEEEEAEEIVVEEEVVVEEEAVEDEIVVAEEPGKDDEPPKLEIDLKKEDDKVTAGEDDEPPTLEGAPAIKTLLAKVLDQEKNPDPTKEGKIPLGFNYEIKGFLNPTDNLVWYLTDVDGKATLVYAASKKAEHEPVIAWYAPGEYSYKLAILDDDGKLRDEKFGGQIIIVFKETGTPEPKEGAKNGEIKEIIITITPEIVLGDIEPIVVPVIVETTIITKEITETVTVSGGGGGTSYPQCSDNQNNDDDNFIDFPADPGCNNADDNTESPDPVTRIVTQCADGIDNDENGFTDYPGDNGCINENDNSEETKLEIIASVEVPKTEITDTIIKANSCLSKSPENKITALEDIKADHPAGEMIANLQKLAYNSNPIIVGRQIKDKYYFEADKTILRPEFFKLAAWPSCLAQSATAKGLWDIKKGKNYKDKEFNENFWAYDIVNALTKLNMVEGYDDGTVGLSKNITRAEIIKLLLDAYALRIYLDTHGDLDFSSYNKEAVLKEVFADSIAKYDKSPFPDISGLNKPWFYNYALISHDLEITKGIEGLFNGEKFATRLEAATMVYNFFMANIEKQQAEAVDTVKEITFIRTFMSPRYGSF